MCDTSPSANMSTPCPVCNLDDFCKMSSGGLSQDNLSSHLHQDHSVGLNSAKILAKTLLNTARESATDVEVIAPDVLILLRRIKSLQEENSEQRRKMLEMEAACQNTLSEIGTVCKKSAEDLFMLFNEVPEEGLAEVVAEEQTNDTDSKLIGHPAPVELSSQILDEATKDIPSMASKLQDQVQTDPFPQIRDEVVQEQFSPNADQGGLRRSFPVLDQVVMEDLSPPQNQMIKEASGQPAPEILFPVTSQSLSTMQLPEINYQDEQLGLDSSQSQIFTPTHQNLKIQENTVENIQENTVEKSQESTVESHALGYNEQVKIAEGATEIPPATNEQIKLDEGPLENSFATLVQTPEKDQGGTQMLHSSSRKNTSRAASVQDLFNVKVSDMDPFATSSSQDHDQGATAATTSNESDTNSHMESSPKRMKRDEKFKEWASTMNIEEIKLKAKTKIKKFSTDIKTSARNLQDHINYVELLKEDPSNEPEIKDRENKLKELKVTQFQLEKSANQKIKKLQDLLELALKNGPIENEDVDSNDDGVVEVLAIVKHKHAEARLAWKRVLKLAENDEDTEPDDDTDQQPDQEINYDPPPVSVFTCQECSKVFGSSKMLSEHKKEHLLHDSFYRCKSCLMVFTNAATLLVHQQRHPEGSKKKKKCPFAFCTFSANSDIHVLRHTRSIHTKEKLFACHYCDQTFSSYQVVSAHVKKHEDETKERCQECKIFYKKENPHKCLVAKK